ncbi:uncharacterized protein F4822DRAFT_394296 [Hypoxylon trugodes]|uniref:uncharacterized protein n=1 Tax=Hypoxylon trugodes TaxID=326681 RepID=UPI0021918D55|nr:uncharacterized protein F4822DRAFT_394296 [Hypoxylon trugodes]KAI1390731.1 hypothetical protein F4822DRAFT_394296 [Hypoxylon trugodes]
MPLAQEEHWTKKVKNSAHCIQMIEPKDVNAKKNEPLNELQLAPATDDSSNADDTSGDESNYEKYPGTREEYLESERIRKQKWRQNPQYAQARKDTAKNITRKMRGIGGWDFLLFEYVENGDLGQLIGKLAVQTERETGEMGRVPNMVLWSFWLCLIRACIAMEYPPRKFHPNRKRPEKENDTSGKAFGLGKGTDSDTDVRESEQEDLIESIPPSSKAARRQNLVHFNIDPTNIYIGEHELDRYDRQAWDNTRKEFQKKRTSRGLPEKELRPIPQTGVRSDRIEAEHQLVPRLKLAEFGLADKIKVGKRNIYYLNRRARSHHQNYAPEQFAEDWDLYQAKDDFLTIDGSRVAGFYGPHTNVWGIAWVMWSLITKFYPPASPEPQIPDGIEQFNIVKDPKERTRLINEKIATGTPVSYCPLLMAPGHNNFFGWVDKDLRETIYRCMYHCPDHRPTLEDLMKQATQKVEVELDVPGAENVRQWINKWIYDAMDEGENYDPPPSPSPDGGPPPPPGGPSGGATSGPSAGPSFKLPKPSSASRPTGTWPTWAAPSGPPTGPSLNRPPKRRASGDSSASGPTKRPASSSGYSTSGPPRKKRRGATTPLPPFAALEDSVPEESIEEEDDGEAPVRSYGGSLGASGPLILHERRKRIAYGKGSARANFAKYFKAKGFRPMPLPKSRSKSGFEAIIDSLPVQFNLPAGVVPPTVDELMRIYQALWDRGDFVNQPKSKTTKTPKAKTKTKTGKKPTKSEPPQTPDVTGEKRSRAPTSGDVLAAVLAEWAENNNMMLDLGYIWPTGGKGRGKSVQEKRFDNQFGNSHAVQTLWIYNSTRRGADDKGEDSSANHFAGLEFDMGQESMA